MADAPHTPGWRVTAQQETTRQVEGGRFVTGVLIMFTTQSGVAGSVFLPDASYNAANAKAAIAARVAQLEHVQGLTG